MKIIKEGKVEFSGGNIIISGWTVEGGTSDELINYAISRVPINFLLLQHIFNPYR